MTAQIPEESSAHSHKTKVYSIILPIIIICAVLIGFCLYFADDDYSYRLYNDAEDFENTFNNNREDFDEILSVLDNSDLWGYLFDIGRPSIMNPSIQNWDDFLTDEEYNIVCDFLQTYGPHSMRDYYEAFYMCFLCKTEDVTLYYTELEGRELDRYLSYIEGQDKEITQIDEKWYLAVKPCEFVREKRED